MLGSMIPCARVAAWRRIRKATMITVYTESQGKLLSLDSDLSNLQQVVWIDLLRPTAEEEAQVEAALRIDIPTREEMQEIEVSSRLYLEEEAAFMTATLPARESQ